MNEVYLLGYVATDPLISSTATGAIVANFRLAVDRQSSEGITDFIDIVAWGALARLTETQIEKGDKIMIKGHLQVRTWEPKDQMPRRVMEVIANKLYKIEKKNARPNED